MGFKRHSRTGDREFWERLQPLYDKAKELLDPEWSSFHVERTNEALLEIFNDAQEIQTDIDEQIEK